ncbi:MAG: polysaccharide pyruvyl transferase family protein [Patescibacteria group bacterium]
MKIVIAGNYGAKNLGDEMILEGLLESLKSVVPSAEITVLSGDPKETVSKYAVGSEQKFPAGLRSLISSIFDRTKAKGTSSSVKNCDYFILGGGGLFNDMSFKANIIWGVQAFMAYFYKKPVIMYGQSVGPLKGFFTKKLVKKLFQKAKLITVRDEDSKECLKNLGVTKPIYVIPDMAFNIPPQAGSIKTSGRLPADRHGRTDTLKMVVALRQYGKIPKNFKKTLADFFSWLIEDKKFTLDFVDFQSGDKGDYALTKEICESNSPLHIPKIKHLHGINSTKDILEIFSGAGYVFGMRLHSIISAIKTHTPFIAVNYSKKVSALLGHHGLEEFMVDFTTELEEMKKMFLKLEKEHLNISNRLKDTAEKAVEAHAEAEKLLKKTLLFYSSSNSILSTSFNSENL